MIGKTYLHDDNMKFEYTVGEIEKYNTVNTDNNYESSSHVEENNNLPKLIPLILKTAYPIIPESLDIPFRKHSKKMSHQMVLDPIKENEFYGSFSKQVNLKHSIGGRKNLNIVILERNPAISNRSATKNKKNRYLEDEINLNSNENFHKSNPINEEDEYMDTQTNGNQAILKNYHSTNIILRTKSNSMTQTYKWNIEEINKIKLNNLDIDAFKIEKEAKDQIDGWDKLNDEIILKSQNNLSPNRKSSRAFIDMSSGRKINETIIKSYETNPTENKKEFKDSALNNVVDSRNKNSNESCDDKKTPTNREQSLNNIDNNFNFSSNQERRFKRKDIANAKNYFKFRYITEKLMEVNNLIHNHNNNNISFTNNLKVVNTLTSSKDFTNSPAVVYSADDKNVIKFTCIFLQKMEKSIFLFNMKKFEDSYIYLKESNIVKKLEEYGEILLTFPGFDKFIIGEFLSKEKKPNENYELTHIFIKLMDFRGDYFLDSFRFLLSRMNLPNDGSQIFSILDVFSTIYYQDNIESKLFQDVTSIYLISSTIISLNSMFHNESPDKKIVKKEEFVKMNSNVDKNLCEEVYDEIKTNKLDIIYDYNEQIYRKLDMNNDEIMRTMKRESAMGLANNRFNTTNVGGNPNIYLNNYNKSDVGASPGPTCERTNIVNGEELIQMLKNGQKFIKYGKSGDPHERFVYLSPDENYMIWRPLTCTCFTRDRSIKTTSFINIYLGTSNSQIFGKYKIPPEYELNCFSIIFNNRSLDFKHEDQKISIKWYNAIKFLIKRIKSMAEVKKKKLKELSNRKEIISDFWRTEILPNWEKYRKFLLIKGNSNCQNQFFTNNEIYKKKFKNLQTSTNKKTKLIIEEKDKQDVVYLWFLGIPNWLRQKLWSLVIANDINFNENLFNFYLKKNENIEFDEDILTDRNINLEMTPKARNEKIMAEIKGIQVVDDNKMIDGPFYKLNNPLVNEIISDVQKSYRRFEEQIKSEKVEEKIFKLELFKILRIFTNYRPDITYSRPIAYIATVFYLNSEDFYQSFILTSNFIIPSFLTKFLIRDEIFIKTRCEFFENLLGNFIPSVYTHLKNLDISTRLFFYDWIEFLYTKTFKYETIVRIWDCFLAKGEIFLYEVALSLIKLQEKDLVNSTVKGILMNLSFFSDKFTEDDLFEVIEKIDISYEYKLLIEQDELAKEKTHLYSAFLYY